MDLRGKSEKQSHNRFRAVSEPSTEILFPGKAGRGKGIAELFRPRTNAAREQKIKRGDVKKVTRLLHLIFGSAGDALA